MMVTDLLLPPYDRRGLTLEYETYDLAHKEAPDI